MPPLSTEQAQQMATVVSSLKDRKIQIVFTQLLESIISLQKTTDNTIQNMKTELDNHRDDKFHELYNLLHKEIFDMRDDIKKRTSPVKPPAYKSKDGILKFEKKISELTTQVLNFSEKKKNSTAVEARMAASKQNETRQQQKKYHAENQSLWFIIYIMWAVFFASVAIVYTIGKKMQMKPESVQQPHELNVFGY